jgi:hypothetical protein
MFEVFGIAHDKVVELDGPITLRCRLLRDVLSELCRNELVDPSPVVSTITGRLMEETGMGRDYGAAVLVEAEAKWAQMFLQRLAAEKEESKGRPPRAALHEVQKLKERSNLDLPDVRSDIERELGRLLLACGEKEGARGAYERARDLAPDPRRREAAEEALKALGDGK